MCSNRHISAHTPEADLSIARDPVSDSQSIHVSPTPKQAQSRHFAFSCITPVRQIQSEALLASRDREVRPGWDITFIAADLSLSFRFRSPQLIARSIMRSMAAHRDPKQRS
jgi:hypothetical protein